ncbi:hypothetical protein ACWFQ8_06915 [Streptomyces sp. NPDC055254]
MMVSGDEFVGLVRLQPGGRDHLTALYQALGLPEGPQARRLDAGRIGTPQTARGSRTDTLRQAGNRSIAAGLHEVSYAPHTRPLDLLRLP